MKFLINLGILLRDLYSSLNLYIELTAYAIKSDFLYLKE